MGDGNQRFSPLAMALSQQARYPLLRHDRIGAHPRYRDERTRFHLRVRSWRLHRLGQLTVQSDRFATTGQECADMVFGLPGYL